MVNLLRLTTFAAAAMLSAAPLFAEEFSELPIGALIVHDESGGRNVPNFRYDAHHTAGGICQMTDETWRRVAPTIDIDLGKFPNAGSASEFQQNQACWKLLATDGVWPWACCNRKLREHLSQQQPHLLKVRREHEKPDGPASEPLPQVKTQAAAHNWNVFAADDADSGAESFLITGESR